MGLPKYFTIGTVLILVLAVAFQQYHSYVVSGAPDYPGRPVNMPTLIMQGLANARRNREMLQYIESDLLHPYDDNLAKAKTVLLTGATSGLGFGVAVRLIAAGRLRLILPARKANDAAYVKDWKSRLESGALDLLLSNGNDRELSESRIRRVMSRLRTPQLDLASFDSIEKCAEEVGAYYDGQSSITIEVLINNAGMISVYGGNTVDGFEKALGINYIGTAYFTEKLREVGAFSAWDPVFHFPRIVMVSSEEHRFTKSFDLSGTTNFGDPYDWGPIGTMGGYGYSKFALTTYSHELSRRWKGKARVYDICPGPVASDIASSAPWPLNLLVKLWMDASFIPAIDAALPVVFLALYPTDEHVNAGEDLPVHWHMAEARQALETTTLESTGQFLWESTRKIFEKKGPLSR